MSDGPAPDFEAYRLRRVCDDLYARSLIGPPFYVVACLLIWLVGGFGGFVSAILLGSALLFGLLWELRRRHKVPADTVALPTWERSEWALVVLGYVLWAALVILLAAVERAATMAVIVSMLASAAFAAASAATFTSDLKRLRLCLIVLALPFLLYWMPWQPELRVYAWVLLVFLLYCLLLGRRLNEEYSTHLRLEFELQVSRAAMEAMARTDALTGLWNRREYEAVFAAAWQRRSRNISPLCLLILDLDDFKQVNDRHGHQVGDHCLQHAAERLRHQFRRSNDLVARIGGEEFAVILPDTDRAEALHLAETFRADLEATPCVSDAREIRLTASIGVGEINMAQDASPDASFARVDGACYEAKRGGRNRVISA